MSIKKKSNRNSGLITIFKYFFINHFNLFTNYSHKFYEYRKDHKKLLILTHNLYPY